MIIKNLQIDQGIYKYEKFRKRTFIGYKIFKKVDYREIAPHGESSFGYFPYIHGLEYVEYERDFHTYTRPKKKTSMAFPYYIHKTPP